MPRIARIVLPNMPHHVVQRGNRRQETFFRDSDYRAYLSMLARLCEEHGVAVWAYCLMPNHVHLVLVPETADSLSGAVAETHRLYTRRINKRNDWKGFLWQGRFNSYPMDESYLLTAVRYVEMNPCAAGLVGHPGDWPWSSARAHLQGVDDDIVRVRPMLEMVPDWRRYLDIRHPSEFGPMESLATSLASSLASGRPQGRESFVEEIERQYGLYSDPDE